MRVLLLLAMIWLAGAGEAPPVAEAAPDPAIQEALRRGSPDWYDPQRDAWRRVEVEAQRERELELASGPALSVLPSILYALILVTLVALVVWLLLSARQLAGSGSSGGSRPLGAAAALSDLPFAVAATGDPEAELERALAAGDHRAALIWVYACLLLRLDAAGRLRLHRSKTNRSYLRELAADDPAQPLLRSCIEAFEQVYFGGAPADAELLRRLYAGYRALDPARSAA